MGNSRKIVYEIAETVLDRLVNTEGRSEIGIKAKNIKNEFKNGNNVCLPQKSLYGLKQAGRS